MANLTAEQRESLKKQRWDLVQLLTSGAKQVSHEDKSVVFKTNDEITLAIEKIDRLLLGDRKTRIIKVYAKRDV